MPTRQLLGQLSGSTFPVAKRPNRELLTASRLEHLSGINGLERFSADFNGLPGWIIRCQSMAG